MAPNPTISDPFSLLDSILALEEDRHTAMVAQIQNLKHCLAQTRKDGLQTPTTAQVQKAQSLSEGKQSAKSPTKEDFDEQLFDIILYLNSMTLKFKAHPDQKSPLIEKKLDT